MTRHTACFLDEAPAKSGLTGCIETLDEASLILANAQHVLLEKLKLGDVEAVFTTNPDIRRVDSSLQGFTVYCRGDESVMDLLYRLNLQRRGSMKSIMQSSQGKRAEIGFDTNWDFLERQLHFEE